jgi:hypothetical protein
MLQSKQFSYLESMLWIAGLVALAALWCNGAPAFANLFSDDPSQMRETSTTATNRRYLETSAGRPVDGMTQADNQVPGGSPGGGHMKNQKEQTRDVTLAEIAKKHPGNGMFSDKDMNGAGSMGVPLSAVSMKNVPEPMISAMQDAWPEFPKAGRLTGPGLEMAMETGLAMYSGMNNSPETQMHAAEATGQAQAEQAGDASADCARDQAASAIGFCSSYVENFTTNPIWNLVRNQIFVPMAVLLLLPGAVLAQMRAIIAAGSPVLGEVNPFEGILRSIVAIFLIPGTALVVNYGIDLNNSIAYTISSEYFRIFGSDMYRDALCAEIRATPVRQPQTNRNALDQSTYVGKAILEKIPTAFGDFEGRMMEDSLQDPCAGIDLAPSDRTNEAMSSGVAATRLMMNGSNASLAAAWNILCAFQLAYLYYLWCVGPIMAALWVYPLRTLRNALPSWTEGVVTLCFWSLFWNTVILLMACFKGVDETGTVIMTALNFLATASVKYAFDFAGLVKAAGQEAAGMAAGAAQQAAQAGGGGAGKGGGACGSKSTGASAKPSGVNQGMQHGRLAYNQGSRKNGHGAGGHGNGESTKALVADSKHGAGQGTASGAEGSTESSGTPESRWNNAIAAFPASAGGRSGAEQAPFDLKTPPLTVAEQNAFFDALAAGLVEPPPVDLTGPYAPLQVAFNDTNYDKGNNGYDNYGTVDSPSLAWQMFLQNQTAETATEQKLTEATKALEVARSEEMGVASGADGSNGSNGLAGSIAQSVNLNGANGVLLNETASLLTEPRQADFGISVTEPDEAGVLNIASTQPVATAPDDEGFGVGVVPASPPPLLKLASATTGANDSSLNSFTDKSLNSFSGASFTNNSAQLSFLSQGDNTALGNLIDLTAIDQSVIDPTPLSNTVAFGNEINLPNDIADGAFGTQPFGMLRDDNNGATVLGGGDIITFHPPGAEMIDQSQFNGGDISFNNPIALTCNTGGTLGSTFSDVSRNAPFNQLGGTQVTDPNLTPVGNGTAIFSSAPVVDAPVGPLPNTSVFANNTMQLDPNTTVNTNLSSTSKTDWSEHASTYLSSNQSITNGETTGLPSVNNSHHVTPGTFDSFIQSSDFSANSTNTYASTYAPTYEHQGGGSSSVAPPAYTPSASQAGYAAYATGGTAADANWQVSYSVPPTTTHQTSEYNQLAGFAAAPVTQSVTDSWFSSNSNTEVAYHGSAPHHSEQVYCQPSLGPSPAASTEVAYNDVATYQTEQTYSYPSMGSSAGSSPVQVAGHSDLGLSLPIIPKHLAAQAAPAVAAEKVTSEQLTPNVSAMRPLNRLAKAMGRATCNSLPAPGNSVVAQRISQPVSTNSGAVGNGTTHSGTVDYARYQPQALNGNEPPPVFEKMPDSLQSVVMLGNQRGGRNPKADEEYESAMKAQLDAITGANQVQS